MNNLVDLLIAERKHHSQWWTVLNELRIGGELPDWLRIKDTGSATDYERYGIARRAVTFAIFGKHSVTADDVLDAGLVDQQVLIDLIEAERDFPLRWWTVLNEARARLQLPDWALQMSVGHEPDISRWRAKAGAVNLVLFNTDYVRGSTSTARAAAHRITEAI
jgi:hypothetical protein